MADVTDLFKPALAAAMAGDVEQVEDVYLDAYEKRIRDNEREIAKLKRLGETLNEEHTAICVVISAYRK